MHSVLFVDDEPELLEIGKLFLEISNELTLDTRTNAREALQALKIHHYDAIVSDYQMPEMNGITFLKEVRSIYGDIPFIIFTGKGREEVVIEALNNGADFYLQKGGEPQILYQELMHVIKRTILLRETQLSYAEQQQRYHDIQNANDLIHSIDHDGHFLFVNKKWLDTLGYEENDLADMTIFDIIHEESLDHFNELNHRVHSGENVGIIDVVFKTCDGAKVYAQGAVYCKMSDGKPQYTRGIFKDVTDRKLTEAALMESEEKFRTLVETCLDGILILDPEGLILFANPAAGQIIGVEDTRDMYGSRNVLEFITPESRKDVIRDFGQVAQGIDGYLARYKVTTIDSRERWVESIGKKFLLNQKSAVLISLRDITDRQIADRVLQESEKKFRTIFENSPYPISINSLPDGKFIAVNEAFRKSSGYSEDEVIGKTPIDIGLLSLLDFGKLSSHLLLSGRIENVPMALKGKGGKRVNVYFSTIPVTINDRPAIMTVTAEITKLKRIEEELLQKNSDLQAAYKELKAVDEKLRQNYDELNLKRQTLHESEEKFRALVENSLEGIFIVDFSGTLLFANPAAGDIIEADGYRELIGKKNVLDFVALESRESVLHDFSQVAQGIDAYLVRYKLITEKNREIWVECIGKKIPFGEAEAMLVSMRDITERRKAEENVRESENKFNTIFRNSPVSFTLTQTIDGKFIDVNDAFSRKTGYERESVIGKTADELKIFPDASEREEMISSIWEGSDISGKEMHCRIKSGEIRNCMVSSKLIFIGEKPHLLTTVQDITERKRMEEDLHESNKKIQLISSITRHDINNQLTVIGGFLDLLNREALHPDIEEYLTGIRDATNRISSMIRFTKTYGRIGDHAPIWQDARSLVENVAKNSPLQSIELENDIPAGTEVFSDPIFEHVFYNLLDNSIRHGRELTKVRVSCMDEEDCLKIVWEDDGVGIPQDQKEQIFQQGYGKNTGLGLSLSQEILDITGIRMQETGEFGKGARFELRVPAGMYRYRDNQE